MNIEDIASQSSDVFETRYTVKLKRQLWGSYFPR